MSERFGNYVDKFDGVALNSRWTVFTGPVTVTGGAIVNTVDFDIAAGAEFPTSGHVPGDFTGKYIIQDFKTSPNFGSWMYVNTFPYVDYLGFDIFGGNIELSSSASPGSPVWSAVYDHTVHRAIRIREDGGTLYAGYWDGNVWTEVYSEPTGAWVATSTGDSQGGYVDGTPGPGENVTIYGYNVLRSSEAIDFWCLSSATDPESSDLGDLGDFDEPDTPAFTSQKNIVDVGFDPRTATMVRTQGGFGSFGEAPPTNMQVSHSLDCGKIWSSPIDFGDFLEGNYQDPPFNVFTIPDFFHLPVSLIPGAFPGQWLLFDYVGAYYLSSDNGVTWSARQMSGITPVQSGSDALYYGIVGINGQFNTRHIAPHHYLDLAVPQIGYSFTLENPFRVGIRRSLGFNGEDGWENSLPATAFASGGTGWAPGSAPPLLHGANGKWIAAVGWQQTFDDEDPEIRIPPMRINTSTDLDPDSWLAPFWPVSEAWATDMYAGLKTGGSYGSAFLKFEFGGGRLKFSPITDHPAGGRWWLMGMQDSIIYSDDGGFTWSNSLADHTSSEDAMHPILNWRASHALGYRYTPSMITDILTDPFGSGRMIAIGVTYARTGITNRLAVFSCSLDGGVTWGPVGQLAMRLSNITSVGTGPDFDSPAMARHIFPCSVG